MKTRKNVNYFRFVKRQKPYKVECSHCFMILDGDSKEEVVKKIIEEKWGVILGSLFCNECYEIVSWK